VKEPLPDLFDDPRPREIVTRDSAEYFRTVDRLRSEGAHIEAVSTVTGHNAHWRLTVRYPNPPLCPT